MKKYFKITLLVLILIIGLFMTRKVNAAEITMNAATVTYGTMTNGEVPVTLTFSQDLKDGALGDGWTISGKTAKKIMKQGSIYQSTVVHNDGSFELAQVAVPIELKVGETLDMSSIESSSKDFSVTDTSIATVSGTKIKAEKIGKTTLKGSVNIGSSSGVTIADSSFTWDLTVVDGSSQNPAKDPINDSDKNPVKDPNENSDWTDFSKAEYSIKEENLAAKLHISNVTPKDSHIYKYLITDSTTEPQLDKSSLTSLTYKDKTFVGSDNNIGNHIALNKDMYLWIYDIYNEDYKLVVNGIKIEKPEFQKYTEAFGKTTVISKKDATISLKYPINLNEQNRKINIKIGKISDNKILQKISKNDASGFSDLLNYAKTSDLLYNNTVIANNTHGYSNSNGSLPDFNSSSILEDGAYYFLYVELDDENGKYIPIESVTLAQAHVNDSVGYIFFFYGSGDFQWSNMDGDSNLNEEQPDNTKSKVILPATGEKAVIGVIALFVIIALITRLKLRNKYKGIQ